MGSTSEVVPTYIGHDKLILAHGIQVQQDQRNPGPSKDETLSDLWSSLLGGLDPTTSTSSSLGISTTTSSTSSSLGISTTTFSTSSSLDISMTSFPSTSSLPTQTSSQSSSSYFSTQSRTVTAIATYTPPAQVNALSGSTIAGIIGGIIGAMILGAFGTFIFMRRIKKRFSSHSSQQSAEKPRPDGQSRVRASMNAIHELDEQRNPSEMPPNKPMAWELQGSNNFTIWELPA